MTPARSAQRQYFSGWEGPDAILLTSDTNERFILEPTDHHWRQYVARIWYR